MRRLAWLGWVGFTTALIQGGQAAAADSTTDFQVRVTITSTCNAGAVTATDVDFGSVSSSATDVTATGQLQVLCTSGTAYTVALDNGDNAAAGSRQMVSGGNVLPYGLYRSAGTTEPWTALPGQVHTGTGTGTVQQIPVYGVLPSANVPAGAYVDTVTATLTY